MSKKVKCPSCEMEGDPEGGDYELVTIYHGRPVLKCLWCDSHVLLRRMGGAMVLDLNHKAIRHLRSDLDHDEMVSLLLDHEDEAMAEEQVPSEVVLLPAGPQDELAAAAENPPAAGEAQQLVAAVEDSVESGEREPLVAFEAEAPLVAEEAGPRRKRGRKAARRTVRLAEFRPADLDQPAELPPPADLQSLQPEPAMLAEAPVDNTPVLRNPDADQHNTPVGTGTELVSSIPLDAKALDHASLMQMAAQVGWVYATPVRKQPEWMNFELPPPVEMGPFRTKLQATINMIKYFRINAGTREQRRAETLARRQRLVVYRRRMFNDKLEALNAVKAIEYKAPAV